MKNSNIEKYKSKLIDYLIPIILSLVIATILFIFRDTIRSFLNRASGTVNALKVN